MKRSAVIRSVWNWPEEKRLRGKFYNGDSGGGCVEGAMFQVLGVPPSYITAACLGLAYNKTISGLNAAPSELCRFVDTLSVYLTQWWSEMIFRLWDGLGSWKLATISLWLALPKEVLVYVPPAPKPQPRPKPVVIPIRKRSEELVTV